MSTLELFILAMIERGFETPYELHRNAGLSLGATNPALKRLNKARLIAMEKESTESNRPRHRYALTSAGRNALQLARKQPSQTATGKDLDTTLRSVVLAILFSKPEKARDILLQSAATRSSLAAVRKLDSSSAKGQLQTFNSMDPLKAFVESSRCSAEAKAFRELAAFLKTPRKSKGPAPRRRSNASTKG
jgi:DNA-binding PadR family transcriptional regulator